ncbi:hypothetical protein CMEL01_00776 [Colletotrichum melonis]|uniref:Uncharacterized protein n=1 Tax=Colletotrichum melonis TaxID=1209925 RepID=A0AAI9V597_9PEZI|nr:hypothetical protein CMEL01_00776 [Colletotrichum melonis]
MQQISERKTTWIKVPSRLIISTHCAQYLTLRLSAGYSVIKGEALSSYTSQPAWTCTQPSPIRTRQKYGYSRQTSSASRSAWSRDNPPESSSTLPPLATNTDTRTRTRRNNFPCQVATDALDATLAAPDARNTPLFR